MTDETSDTFLRNIAGGSSWGENPKRIGVAVSGGSDSMALLELLTHWAGENGVELRAATVDHGLRVEAKEEAAFVAAFCAGRGIRHDVLTWDGWDGTGNLQAEARAARYRLLADWAREAHVDAVGVAHTANDQAETFLMRLSRSSGVDGLSAMEHSFLRHGIRFVRPLLGQTREVLRDYLRRHDVAWVDDPSNSDTRFDRVKAREAFEALRPLGISERTMTASTRHLSMATAALQHYAIQEAKAHVVEDRGDLILPRMMDIPVEIERRLVVGALQYIGGDPYPPRSAALVEMEIGLTEAGKHTLAGCVITREGDATRFTRELQAVADVKAHTELFWDRRWKFDGPHEVGLEVRALGEDGLRLCPDWRETGMPPASLLASPGIWRGEELIAAPIAGLANGWQARVTKFPEFLREISSEPLTIRQKVRD